MRRETRTGVQDRQEGEGEGLSSPVRAATLPLKCSAGKDARREPAARMAALLQLCQAAVDFSVHERRRNAAQTFEWFLVSAVVSQARHARKRSQLNRPVDLAVRPGPPRLGWA